MDLSASIQRLLVIFLFTAASQALAANSHYVPGIAGNTGSNLPPPGLYYKGTYVNYEASQAVKVNAFSHRLIWVTPQKALGGDLVLEATLPWTDTKLIAAKDKQKGFGDLFVGANIGWHGNRWDAVLGAGYWATTGKYSSNHPASPGKEDPSIMLTYGGLVELNEGGDLTFNALGRYEIQHENKLHGDEIIMEWSLGKKLGLAEVGFIGYSTKEIGKLKQERHALGALFGHFWPRIGLGADLAYYKEVSATNRPKGRVIRASFTKRF